MLPMNMKPQNFGGLGVEKWEDYCGRIGLSGSRAYREFVRQVVYDHFNLHNSLYPEFDINDFEFESIYLSVKEIKNSVRYFRNEQVDWWGEQYEEFKETNYPYIIFEKMSENKTPPFPPVIIQESTFSNNDGKALGSPFHLVEGTHRVSYLLHMAKIGDIEWNSTHEFIILKKV
ncbi:hypothetical protein H4J63_00790 [Pseudoalteromonas sp. 5Ae-yellow]|uniref:hypothetical protein n=1 Tax=Pseudoalteromonas sp. 5Ae-yellow TaxID=2759847 RepID=UPI0015F46C8E|nr:hypothetical protein [Pseudoalteromonas sp. 5Ae-yellow]MBA6407906.1 hypothetical protein [Pseudoalteromonas sp. 5Ae-yellow]